MKLWDPSSYELTWADVIALVVTLGFILVTIIKGE